MIIGHQPLRPLDSHSRIYSENTVESEHTPSVTKKDKQHENDPMETTSLLGANTLIETSGLQTGVCSKA